MVFGNRWLQCTLGFLRSRRVDKGKPERAGTEHTCFPPCVHLENGPTESMFFSLPFSFPLTYALAEWAAPVFEALRAQSPVLLLP